MSSRVRKEPQNLLLAGLPAAERKRLKPKLEAVQLTVGEVLAEPGTPVDFVYFPVDSFISLITPTEAHTQIEVGIVGDEGMLGLDLVLGVKVWALRALVQGSGKAWRMDAATFSRELRCNTSLRTDLNLYLYVVLSQIAQSAACNRFHLIDARLARWLLLTRDRAHADQFIITHKFLAYMLGVRRVGVTRAASDLQRKALIRYKRGALQILDVKALEALACSCYASAKATYQRAFA